MWIAVILLCIVFVIVPQSHGLDFIDLPSSEEDRVIRDPTSIATTRVYPPVRSTGSSYNIQRRWLAVTARASTSVTGHLRTGGYEDEKDVNLKNKIATLVEQTMHDTERKIKALQPMKDSNREQPPYRAGFILSMVKKSRDVLNELFNVAVRHRDDWKALEQLKIFELIVHTNVDTTHLVRQLVELHVQSINATNSGMDKRVVLL